MLSIKKNWILKFNRITSLAGVAVLAYLYYLRESNIKHSMHEILPDNQSIEYRAIYGEIQTFCQWRKIAIMDPTLLSSVRMYIENPRKIYIGSGSKKIYGWESFQQSDLDVAKQQDFEKWFCPESIGAFLSEHTYEHIPYNDTVRSFKYMYKYLIHGGYFRVAIPIYDSSKNGRPPHPLDIKYGHVNRISVEELADALKTAGFDNIRKLEYMDSNGKVHTTEWDRCMGFIDRSIKYDHRNIEWRRRKRCEGINISKADEIIGNIFEKQGLVASTIIDAYKI